MTVKELIEELKKLPPEQQEMEVKVYDNEYQVYDDVSGARYEKDGDEDCVAITIDDE
jgi:hypothetical protein